MTAIINQFNKRRIKRRCFCFGRGSGRGHKNGPRKRQEPSHSQAPITLGSGFRSTDELRDWLKEDEPNVRRDD
jgi:hypothetical protein